MLAAEEENLLKSVLLKEIEEIPMDELEADIVKMDYHNNVNLYLESPLQQE